jgi:CHAT domain-containing protein
VVMTLWSVSDSAMSDFMVVFYDQLSKHVPRAESLRAAKLSLLHGPNVRYRHPYYWAGVVLMGDWRSL